MRLSIDKYNLNVFFRFATKECNGLLLYNGRFNEKHDFIAMEIINEQIQLTFSAGRTVFGVFLLWHCDLLQMFFFFIFIPFLSVIHFFHCFSGETKTTVSPYILGGVSDGQWHVVEVHYYNKVLNRGTTPQTPCMCRTRFMIRVKAFKFVLFFFTMQKNNKYKCFC